MYVLAFDKLYYHQIIVHFVVTFTTDFWQLLSCVVKMQKLEH